MRYVLGIFAFIIVVIVAIVLLVNRGPDSRNGEQPTQRKAQISDFKDSDATFVYMTDGKIVAEENHRAIRISVNRNTRKVEVLSGYDQGIEREQTFSNTQSAYATFIEALETAGFTREQKSVQDNEVGKCPLGNRHIYEINQGGAQPLRLWSTTCGNKEGTFAGNRTLIRQLFEAQIPEYRTIVRGVRL